nr:nucleotidyltransferase domain-containing protein [uncultured Desulfuromonas sp.]
MIDLPSAQLEVILRILRSRVADIEVWAFGSRVNGTATAYSDLDLVLVDSNPVENQLLWALKDDFSESDLPILIDLLDWQTISPEFQAIIKRNYVVLQSPEPKQLGRVPSSFLKIRH